MFIRIWVTSPTYMNNSYDAQGGTCITEEIYHFFNIYKCVKNGIFSYFSITVLLLSTGIFIYIYMTLIILLLLPEPAFSLKLALTVLQPVPSPRQRPQRSSTASESMFQSQPTCCKCNSKTCTGILGFFLYYQWQWNETLAIWESYM